MTASEMPVSRPRRFRLRLFRNPVVLKELRGRMRGTRAFVVLTVYLALMGGFTALLYVIASSAQDISGMRTGGNIGRTLFVGIVGIELFLVTFIAPAFTAGAISGERERQTYDLLKTTLLPARSLVIGKMVSALFYVMLLLLAAIPLQSIAFLFGGVTEAEVILAFVILAVTSIALGALGIYFSASMPRTLSANVMTYAAALFLTIGLPLIMFIVAAVLQSWVTRPDHSPTTQALISYGSTLLESTSPLTTAIVTQRLLITELHAGFYTTTFTPPNGTAFNLTLFSPWITFTVLYLLLSVILIILAVRRVRRIEA